MFINFTPLRPSASLTPYQKNAPHQKYRHLTHTDSVTFSGRVNPKKQDTEDFPIVIIGGGLSGLVAADHLRRAGQRVILLEQKEDIGGNTRSGQWRKVAFPRGASVFRIGDAEHDDYCKNILGLPLNQENQLTRPDLYIFPEGQGAQIFAAASADPDYPVPKAYQEGVKKYQEFLDLLKDLEHHIKGEPLTDMAKALDNITFMAFLEENGFQAIVPFVEPITESDFSAQLDKISALAALRDMIGDGTQDYILPGGNFYMAHELKEQMDSDSNVDIRTGQEVLSVNYDPQDTGVTVRFQDKATGQEETIKASKVLVAAPFHKIPAMMSVPEDHANLMEQLPYSTYMLVNLFFKKAPQGLEANRFYLTPKVGCFKPLVFSDFVMTTDPNQKDGPAVVTLYMPMADIRYPNKLGQRAREQFVDLLNRCGIDPQDLLNKVMVTPYTESMTAPATGHCQALEGFSGIYKDGDIITIHSDQSGLPSDVTAFNEGLQGAKRILD